MFIQHIMKGQFAMKGQFTHKTNLLIILLNALLMPLASFGTTLSLNVKIDPPVHDCRFQPAISNVPEGLGITDVRMDLYEYRTQEFSYTLLHEIFDEPLAPEQFDTAFSAFQQMSDGYYADGLGYYHTTWHDYKLTVTLSDGSVASVDSRPFRVPENPFHIFAAQIVTEPYSGSYTYKPGSTIIYNVEDCDPATGQFKTYKQVADISKVKDTYTNWVTTWSDSAFVYGQLPDQAINARNIHWELTGSGQSIVSTITSDTHDNFAYRVRVPHFGEETFTLTLTYTIADSNGNDSTVTLQNHQLMKMRLPTPYFAYDDALYTTITAESDPTDIYVEATSFSGVASPGDFYQTDGSATFPNARLLHLDMLTYIQVAPNVFDNKDLELQITITDTMWPENPDKAVIHTYGPFLYNYDNKTTQAGQIVLKDCAPSQWLQVNPTTGAVSPIPHRISVKYTSGTHEFYTDADKLSQLWQAKAFFNVPKVSHSQRPQTYFENFGKSQWHQCLYMNNIDSYTPGKMFINNNTSIPEQNTLNANEYYAAGTRWTDAANPTSWSFGFVRNSAATMQSTLVPHVDLTTYDPHKWFILDHHICGDGSYTEGLERQTWFEQQNYEVGLGRVYFFATQNEPVAQVIIGDEVLQPVATAKTPRRASVQNAPQQAEAFLPTLSNEAYNINNTLTGVNNIAIDPQFDFSQFNATGFDPDRLSPDTPVDIYTSSGRLVGNGIADLRNLSPGFYIIRLSSTTVKIVVR